MSENIIGALTAKRNDLNKRKQSIKAEYEKRTAEIDRELDQIQTALDTLNEAVKEYLCPSCKGTGTERYCDAAGDMDDRPCGRCCGTGVLAKRR